MADAPPPPSNSPGSQFFQGAAAQSSVSVNTEQVHNALGAIKQNFDELTKAMGVDIDKALSSRLGAESKFYKALGNIVKANQVAILKQKKDYTDAVTEATNLEIEDYKRGARERGKTEEEISAYIRSLRMRDVDLIEKAEISAEKRINAEKRKNWLGGVGLSNIGSRVGGPVGSTISGAGNVLSSLTTPAGLITLAIGGLIAAIVGDLQRRAEYARIGSGLANAGGALGANYGGAGASFENRLFSGLSASAMSLQKRRELTAAFSGESFAFRNEIMNSRGGGSGFQRNLGLYANILPDVGKIMELLVGSTKELGTSQQDLTTIFKSSRVNSDHLRITQMDAVKMELEMQKVLRNMTNDGNVAASVLRNVSGYLDSIGASEVEKHRIGLSIAQAGANLTLPQIAGMFAFTRPKEQLTPGTLFGENGNGGLVKGGGVFGLMGEFIQKVGGQFKNNPMQQMFAMDQLQRQYFPGLRLQDLPKFYQLTQGLGKGTLDVTQASKEFEKLTKNTPSEIAAAGMQNLVNVLGPEGKLLNWLEGFANQLYNKIDGITDAIHSINPLHQVKTNFGHTKGMNEGVSPKTKRDMDDGHPAASSTLGNF